MSRFEKFEEKLPSKEKFSSSLTVKKYLIKIMNMLWNAFELKAMKDYHKLFLKHDVLLLNDVFEKFRNNSLTHFQPMFHFYTP